MPEIQRYVCPGCKGRVMKHEGHCHKMGPWYMHDGCTATCSLCEEAIEPPPFWNARLVEPYLGQPVHAACKRGAT